MEQTNQVVDTLPLERPLREALEIYAKRLGVFLLIVVLSLSILGLIVNENARNLLYIALAFFLVLGGLYTLISRPLKPSEPMIFAQGITPPPTTNQSERIILNEKLEVIFNTLIILSVIFLLIVLVYSFISLLLHFL